MSGADSLWNHADDQHSELFAQAEAQPTEKLQADSRPADESYKTVIDELGIPDDNRRVSKVLQLGRDLQIPCDRHPVAPYISGPAIDDNCGLPIATLYQSVKDSVAQALSRPGDHLLFGTTFKMCDDKSNDCFYVSNSHVSGGADYVAIPDSAGLNVHYSKVLARDDDNDLILLEAPPGDTRKPAVPGPLPVRGDMTFTIGHPYGYPHDVISAGTVYTNQGWVDAKDPITNIVRHLPNVVVSDEFVKTGNSGGPDFNKDGRVIGIKTVSINDGGSITVPISRVTALIDKYENSRH